ncbi:MAG: cytochrome c biogenesis CcdA family protein [Fidelibacterota bacterium]
MAIFGGAISFISPCVLPLVPAYISYITGITVEELREPGVRNKKILNVIILSLFFISGFTVVFMLMGASIAGIFGNFISSPIFYRIAGVIIVIFGLHTARIIPIKFLNYERRLQLSSAKGGVISAFVIGLSFALGWTPCIGPILASILTIASIQDSIARGVFLLLLYSAGLGIPFLLTGIATNSFLGIFNRIKRHFRIVEIVSGLFLVVVGIMIFFNLFYKLSQLFLEIFPWLAKIG